MTTAATITRFGILRHAETRWNREKRIQGQADSPLTPAGRRQADDWGQTLAGIPWSGVLSSGIGRARHTGDIINRRLGAPFQVCETDLREQDWGEWTGKTFAEVQGLFSRNKALAAMGRWEFHPPGGETRQAVFERMCRALERAAAEFRGATLLVVTHKSAIKCLFYGLMMQSGAGLQRVDPACLHWVAHDGERLFIEHLNALSLGAERKTCCPLNIFEA